ncbi:MAG: hypothetical protein IJH07_01260 [Ruminococcus sp.]|nr:hypothetical protein [Ruminococcus sp.]
MKLNEYRAAIGELKIPEYKKSEVLNQLGVETVSDKNTVTSPRKRQVPWIAAVAAVMVLTIIATVVLTSVGGTGNTFSIKAGAAEINTESFVKVGKLINDSSLFSFGFDSDKEDDITDIALSLLNYKEMTACAAFSLDDITYEGDNIQTVEYRICGTDCYLGHGDELGSAMLFKDSQYVGISGEAPDGDDVLISEASDNYMYLRCHDATGAFRDANYLRSFPYAEDDGTVINETEINYTRLFADLFNECRESIYMEVTANFADGTTNTKKLTFEMVENVEDPIVSYVLEAKITE